MPIPRAPPVLGRFWNAALRFIKYTSKYAPGQP
jgi:hypothetical protein